MEIVASIKQKSIIDYNKEEIEKGLTEIEKRYTGMVFTEGQLPEAKEERAKLNKVVTILADYRKQIINESMAEIKPFEEFMKAAEERAKKLSLGIDQQVKKFEENLKIERLAKVSEYLEALLEEKPQYQEFKQQLSPGLDNAVFTNKGSFTAKGEVGQKVIDFINIQLSQFDEILKAREEQEKILQQKRELIISQCKSISEMLGLKIPLSPKQFAYLKDYELSEITNEINRAAKEQRKKEEEAVKKIEEEARIKAEKEALEKIKEEEKQKVVESFDGTQEEFTSNADNFLKKVEETKEVQEVKASTKLFYGVIEFEGIEVSQAQAFSKFLKDNKINYKVIKQEVR